MLKSGDEIILRLAGEGVYLNERQFIPAVKIRVHLADLRPYELKLQPSFIKARVNAFENGILKCSILTFNKVSRHQFDTQEMDISAVEHLWLSGSNTMRLINIAAREPRGSSPQNHSRQQRQRVFASRKSAIGHKHYTTASPLSHDPKDYPIVEHAYEFTFDFDEMEIADGEALFKEPFQIPIFGRNVMLEMRVENPFLKSGYNYIKPYIARRLGRQTVKVSVVIQTQGPEVISVQATSPVVSRITSDLIIQVKHSYIRRKLRDATDGKELVTVDRLFDEDDVHESGLKPDDPQFVKDILSIRKPKHGEHLLYLSARHLHQVMRLRMLKKPFAFLFLIPGKQNSFFVLETLNNKDATYLWALNCTESQLRATPELLRHKYEWVEQEISLISAEGRDAYRKDNPDHFHPVWHEYEQKDGFAIWKDRLQAVLDEDTV